MVLEELYPHKMTINDSHFTPLNKQSICVYIRLFDVTSKGGRGVGVRCLRWDTVVFDVTSKGEEVWVCDALETK